MAKCEVCKRSKATGRHYVERWAVELELCERCRQGVVPTPEEEQAEYERIERESERRAEMYAGDTAGGFCD